MPMIGVARIWTQAVEYRPQTEQRHLEETHAGRPELVDGRDDVDPREYRGHAEHEDGEGRERHVDGRS